MKLHLLLIAVALFLLGCTTPEGQHAKAQAVAVGKNNAVAKQATLDAKDSNAHVTTLDERVDSKDFVLRHAKVIP